MFAFFLAQFWMRCWLLAFCAWLWIAQLLTNSLIPAIAPRASQADLHNCTHLLKLRLKHSNEETSNTSLVTQTLYVSPTANVILHKIRLSLRTAPCFCRVSGITRLLRCYSRVFVLIRNKGFYCLFYSDETFRTQSVKLSPASVQI